MKIKTILLAILFSLSGYSLAAQKCTTTRKIKRFMKKKARLFEKKHQFKIRSLECDEFKFIEESYWNDNELETRYIKVEQCDEQLRDKGITIVKFTGKNQAGAKISGSLKATRKEDNDFFSGPDMECQDLVILHAKNENNGATLTDQL